MKKLLILAIAAIPFFASAQERATTGTTATPAKTSDNKFALANPEVIYLELIASTNSAGALVIKADFGREIISALEDKELTKQLTELRTMNFPSMPDAMNYLASLGYKLQQSYSMHDKEGKSDTHFVYEKRLPRRAGNEGTTKPRPEGSRPAGVKPDSGLPTTKPPVKTGK